MGPVGMQVRAHAYVCGFSPSILTIEPCFGCPPSKLSRQLLAAWCPPLLITEEVKEEGGCEDTHHRLRFRNYTSDRLSSSWPSSRGTSTLEPRGAAAKLLVFLHVETDFPSMFQLQVPHPVGHAEQSNDLNQDRRPGPSDVPSDCCPLSDTVS